MTIQEELYEILKKHGSTDEEGYLSIFSGHYDDLVDELEEYIKNKIIYTYEDGMLNTELSGTFTGETYYNENFKK